jgi:hypothetical protein
MLIDHQGGRRDRVLFNAQRTVAAIIILICTVSCSGPRPDLPQPIAEIVNLFSGTDTPRQQSARRKESQKVRPEQPKVSASPKAVGDAPKATSPSAAKKANTPPATDSQKDQRLYQEFLEWRKRRENSGV